MNRNLVKYREKYLSCITVMYCLSILFSSIARLMNYVNMVTIVMILYYFIITKCIYKSMLCLFWSLYLIVYPLGDAAVRGEHPLLLYIILSYTVPILFLNVSDLNAKNFTNFFVRFVKLLAWIQVAGMFLQQLWPRAYTNIIWRMFGFISVGRKGFTIDAAFTAYLLCAGISLYFIEYAVSDNKFSRNALKKIFYSLIMLVAMVMTGKRSFLIILFTALIVVFLARAGVNSRRFIRTIVFSVVILCLAFLVVMFAYRNGASNALSRIGSTLVGISNGEDVSNMRSTWAGYMNEWRQGHELFGIGWESFKNRILFTPYGGKVPNGHNTYLQIMCETGYVGVSIYVILLIFTFFVSVINVMWFSKNRDREMLVLSMFSSFLVLAFGMYSFLGNAIYDSVIFLYFFGAVRLGAMLQKIKKQKEKFVND